MPRPTNKQELLQLSQSNFSKLMDYINGLGEKRQQTDFPPGTMNRNIRDVLAHLHEWHLMMLQWYKVGMNGQKPDMPARGYTWKTVPELNRSIWEKYGTSPLDDIKLKLQKSYGELQRLIRQHTDEELFEKKYYPWTGSTSLGAYFISATSSHYDWALKLIKKAFRQLDNS